VLFDPAGAPSYAELHERGTTVSLPGVEVRVAAVEDVIAMKRAAGRRKDAAHIVVLLEYLRARDRGG
jgi:predicted nucleotidyltransferase